MLSKTLHSLTSSHCQRSSHVPAPENRQVSNRAVAAQPGLAGWTVPSSVPLQEARHGEAEERLPAQLHPLSGLHAHDADGAALLQVRLTSSPSHRPSARPPPCWLRFPFCLLCQRWSDLRVGARLLLDARAHRGHHERGIWPISSRTSKAVFFPACLLINYHICWIFMSWFLDFY